MHNQRRLESEILTGIKLNPVHTGISTKHFSLMHTVVFAFLKPFISSIFINLKPNGRWIKQANYFRTNSHFINYRARKTYKCL